MPPAEIATDGRSPPRPSVIGLPKRPFGPPDATWTRKRSATHATTIYPRALTAARGADSPQAVAGTAQGASTAVGDQPRAVAVAGIATPAATSTTIGMHSR